VVHGIDLDATRSMAQHRSEVRRELGISDDEVLVGTVANFRREKAYEDLLAAAAVAVERSPRLRFVSVGQGPLESEVRQRAAALGLGERFTFLGYRDDAVRIISGFDVFTLSSRHEGLPVSLMEAMALGTPVVATAVGGIPQAVTDGVEGRLVPVGDPQVLAQALVEIAADPDERHRFGAAALARSDEFDVSRAVRDLEGRYLALAAAVRARRRS
jgi:glycosyltransferase involved in cell wall biosynthesis